MAKDKAAETAEDTPAKGGGKKKLIIIAVVALLALGGVYKFVLAKPATAEAKEPEPGVTLALDPININLADGHFLKLGLSLQFSAEASGHGDPDGSAALDEAIKLFSGEEVSVLSVAKNREKLRTELLEHMNEDDYHHMVLKVWFTNFVMQ
ncbi:flagellar basal body-associated FliL family protein [Motilibacter deserti]|uniref:Flagellar protein FliL n=1 Tax=Motilibacter deserti TaxID=2714956 RepID=A0ABX0H3I0_9ACTN|nr:flagellar basal body-associated FliL family protein [Motilibacter deserti]NHC16515.1 flagellar basal body-associated protein FliL [Motilibacter deserti]